MLAARPTEAQTAGLARTPISDVAYTVTYNRRSAASRVVTSVMTFDVPGAGAVRLSLPAWTPGEYEIQNFARNVLSFTASESGAPILWAKADPDTWEIHPVRAGKVTVSFDYQADTLDNGASWSKPDFLLFNGTNLFLYPDGAGTNFPATVKIATEPDWKVVTGLAQTAALTYTSGNYHDLVDNPFFIGVFDVDSALIAGKWVRFASYPAGSIAGDARKEVWTALNQVIPPEVKVFGEAPWRDYTVMQITEPSYPQGAGAGLEHQSSHVDIVSPLLVGTPVMPSLYAHEIFHAWNVKRLRPAEMVPYRYDREQPTRLLWISEGITDYYADLAEVRGGAMTPAGFYEATRAKMREVAGLPPTALTDASLSTWINVRDGTENIYYPKGSLAGMLLDILIRDATGNRSSLDAVMRSIYSATFGAGRGFTDAEWWAAVSAAAGGKNFDDFRRRYIEGREPMPYAQVFALAGLEAREDTVRAPRVGVQTVQDSTGVQVIDVAPGSSAAEAGVENGDYLISVGDVPVADPDFGAIFRPKYAGAADGAPIVIRVRRGTHTLDLPARLRFATSVQARMAEDPAASPRARAIRAGLLTGTTRP